MFTKAAPDAFRFDPVPERAVEQFGGVERGALHLLLLSWLIWGARRTTPSVWQIGRRAVLVPPGWCAGSMVSMQEDIQAATGRTWTRRQIGAALDRLRECGWIAEAKLVEPETRGRFGKMYDVTPTLRNRESRVDAMMIFKVLCPKGPGAFRWSAAAVGRVDAPRQTVDWLEFVRQNAEAPQPHDVLMSTGAWREGEVWNPKAEVFLPWIVLDVDGDDGAASIEKALAVLQVLEHWGIDLERVHVSWSGRRGWHISIEAGAVGCPVFVNADVARLSLARFVGMLAEEAGVKIDPCTASPLQLVRVGAARHPLTGLHRATWRADLFPFLREQVEAAVEGCWWEPYDWPDPRRDPMECEAFLSCVEEVARRLAVHRPPRKKQTPNGRPPWFYKRVIGGVEEGEVWSDRHAGRDKAAFMLACYWLEQGQTEDEVRRMLSEWNQRNRPPLPEHVLDAKVRSALRTLAIKAKF